VLPFIPASQERKRSNHVVLDRRQQRREARHFLRGTVTWVKDSLAALILLLVRGFLLWLVVPVAALVGVVLKPYRRTMRRPIKIRQLIGWADLNLIAFLERGVLRTLFPNPQPFVPWAEVAHVTHRVNFLDPV